MTLLLLSDFVVVDLPIVLISFVFFLLHAMIITMFKKNIPSFLFTLPPVTTTTTTARSGGDYKLQIEHHHNEQPISPSGLGLIISATADSDHRPPNVVESAMLKPSPPSSPSSSAVAEAAEENTIGFTEDEIDGLMCCTETLGFESSDDRRDHIEQREINGNNGDWRGERRGKCPAKVRSYPPPLTSLNRNGEPSYFLRPVRKDGRLELTEVRIHRPEILHVSRHDGRLTLHLIPDDTSILDDEEDEEEENEEEEEEVVEEEEKEEEEVVEEEEEEEEERVEEWRTRNEGGMRRCHEMVNQHQHHHHQYHHHHHLRMCGISIV